MQLKQTVINHVRAKEQKRLRLQMQLELNLTERSLQRLIQFNDDALTKFAILELIGQSMNKPIGELVHTGKTAFHAYVKEMTSTFYEDLILYVNEELLNDPHTLTLDQLQQIVHYINVSAKPADYICAYTLFNEFQAGKNKLTHEQISEICKEYELLNIEN